MVSESRLPLSTFIKTLYGRNLMDFRRISSLIEFFGSDDGSQEDFVDQLYVVFQLRLLRYLTGHGHPDDPSLRSMLPAAAYSNNPEADAILRSQMFLVMMTHSDVVPVDATWRLTVSISDPSPSFSTWPRFSQTGAPIYARFSPQFCAYQLRTWGYFLPHLRRSMRRPADSLAAERFVRAGF